jgi:hypothetical protein
MTDMSASVSASGPFELVSEKLGCLPIVEHFFGRIGLDERLGRYLPKDDRRLRLAPGKVVAVVVRNIIWVWLLERDWPSPVLPAPVADPSLRWG